MKKKKQSPEEDKERAEDKKSGNEVGEVRMILQHRAKVELHYKTM
jgi:hypothetical protein